MARNRMRNLLAQAVRFAFRVHQFTGGFTTECAAAFDECATLFNQEISQDQAADSG